jgi:phospholipase A1
MLMLPILAIGDSTGEAYFNNKEYDKALPLLKIKADDGSKAAMYRLAHMYENGLGVKKNDKKAIYWFKKAAAAYEYTLETDSNERDESILTKLTDQMDSSIDKEIHENSVNMIDTNTAETKAFSNYLLDDNYFGLKPYHSNFILPISYSKHKYKRISSATHITNYTPLENARYGQYDSNSEVEFQISLKKDLFYDIFGLNENITAAFTQKVWWQLYNDSSPFRETNYLPEVFITIPTPFDSVADRYGLKSIRTGFLHESNGQEGYRSRSWNRIYATANMQWDNLFVSTRAWYILPEKDKYDGYYDGLPNIYGFMDPNDSGDDNPDIHEYLGYGDLKVNYLYGKHEFGGLFRYNFGEGGKNRGATQLHWTYPLLDSENTFLYFKFFNGYGENLIDYNNCVTKTAFGFSFSRGVF